MAELSSQAAQQEKDRSGELTMVTMNLSGRFKGREIRKYGQEVLKHILSHSTVSVFFGQQMNFRPSLPDNFVFEGGTRAFIYYDKNIFRGCDEKQYRHYLKDMENKGRLKRYYLPEANYLIIKMRGRQNPRNKFLAISWMTDECQGKLKSLNLVRKLLSFAADLCAIEEMPVIVGGTFRITLEEAKNIVYTEFEGFRVHGYMATKPKRMLRMSNFFFTAKPVKMDDIRPLICSKIEVHSDMTERWLNPEDAFYWDPVITQVKLRRHIHASSTQKPARPIEASTPVIAPKSPGKPRAEWSTAPLDKKKAASMASDGWSDFTELERRLKMEDDDEGEETCSMKNAISAPALNMKPKEEPEPLREMTNLTMPEKHERTLQSVPDLDNPTIFAKLEDTLKRIEDRKAGRSPGPGVMASTSAEIQETLLKMNADDNEVQQITNNGFYSQGDLTDGDVRNKTPHDFVNPDDYNFSVDLFRKEEKVSGFDTFGLRMELTKQDQLDLQLADAAQLLQSISGTTDMRVVEGASTPNLATGYSKENLRNGGKTEESDAEDGTTLNGVLKKIPSYIELYDEELLENNTVCYMQ